MVLLSIFWWMNLIGFMQKVMFYRLLIVLLTWVFNLRKSLNVEFRESPITTVKVFVIFQLFFKEAYEHFKSCITFCTLPLSGAMSLMPSTPAGEVREGVSSFVIWQDNIKLVNNQETLNPEATRTVIYSLYS